MIKYVPRYSFYEQQDRLGRWARIATINDIQIACVTRFKRDNNLYVVNCDFPTRKHTDIPQEHNTFTDLESAKEFVKEKWEWFKKEMI